VADVARAGACPELMLFGALLPLVGPKEEDDDDDEEEEVAAAGEGELLR
jgi:hypothetical protein